MGYIHLPGQVSAKPKSADMICRSHKELSHNSLLGARGKLEFFKERNKT
jgi:hypothetical protein